MNIRYTAFDLFGDILTEIEKYKGHITPDQYISIQHVFSQFVENNPRLKGGGISKEDGAQLCEQLSAIVSDSAADQKFIRQVYGELWKPKVQPVHENLFQKIWSLWSNLHWLSQAIFLTGLVVSIFFLSKIYCDKYCPEIIDTPNNYYTTEFVYSDMGTDSTLVDSVYLKNLRRSFENGVIWSGDRGKMYFADSILSFHFYDNSLDTLIALSLNDTVLNTLLVYLRYPVYTTSEIAYLPYADTSHTIERLYPKREDWIERNPEWASFSLWGLLWLSAASFFFFFNRIKEREQIREIRSEKRRPFLFHLNHWVDPKLGIPTYFSAIRKKFTAGHEACLLYTSPSPRDRTRSRMPSSA